jgi:hypothetical protein
VLTNSFDGNGAINLSTNVVNPGNPQKFYLLKTQVTPKNTPVWVHSDRQDDLPRDVAAATEFQRLFGCVRGRTT